MKISKLFYLFFNLLLLIGCKNINKEISEHLLKETTEHVAKETTEEFAEISLKTITTKTIKELSWKDLIELISKDNNINLANSLKELSPSLQKKMMNLFQEDINFFRAITTSKTIIDEYSLFCINAPKAAENIDLLYWFSLNRNASRRFGAANLINDITIVEENGLIKFFHKSSNEKIGTFRDGIMTITPSSNNDYLLADNSLIKSNPIPNCIYKIKGKFGSLLSYETDKAGKLYKVKATNISPDELNTNIIYLHNNLNLGNDWRKYFQKISQSSKGDDVAAECLFKYEKNEAVPRFVKLDIKVKDKKIVSETFENLENVSAKTFTTSDNAELLSKFHLPSKKKENLLSEMAEDGELTQLIHANPELNIKRWLNTRNHVDQSKIAKTPNGRLVPNGRVYAGNVYYFHPSLNSALKARLNSGNDYIILKKFGTLSKEELITLDRLYPEGVPFTKEGYPDFSKVAAKNDKNQVISINIGKLSGDSKIDIKKAEALYLKQGYHSKDGFTWHHKEKSTELIRVPTAIHQLIDHAGGMSTHQNL